VPTRSTIPTIWPLVFAVGVTMLLVGLVVNPLAIAPFGAATALAAAWRWVRGGKPASQRVAEPPQHPQQGAERFPRSRLLERATLGLGGVVALGVALPAVAVAVLPSFLGRRKVAMDLGPVEAFPEGRFVVATFFSDPSAGEISRRTAYVRNNGRLGDRPSFTIMSSRCTYVGCPTQPNGPLFTRRHSLERTRTGEVGLVPANRPAGSAVPATAASSTRRGIALPALRPGHSTVTNSRFATATLAWEHLQREPRRGRGRGGANPGRQAHRRRRAGLGARVPSLPARPDLVTPTS
jgi:hypothetical protein